MLPTVFYLLESTYAKVIRLNMMFNNKGLSAINTIPNHEHQMVQKIIKSKLFIVHVKHTRVGVVASKFLFINCKMNIKLTISRNMMVIEMNGNNVSQYLLDMYMIQHQSSSEDRISFHIN